MFFNDPAFDGDKYKKGLYSSDASNGIKGHIKAWEKNEKDRFKNDSLKKVTISNYHRKCIHVIARKNRNLSKSEKKSIYNDARDYSKKNLFSFLLNNGAKKRKV